MTARDDAIALYNQAKDLENSDTSSFTIEEKEALQQEVVDLLTQANNICPHENEIRREDLDVTGITVYQCQDCFNLSYIQQ